MAAQALAEKPYAGVAAFLKIMATAGATLRLRKAAPLHFTIDLDRLDSLYRDTSFREACGLAPLPPSKYKLRRLIKEMRKKKKMPLQTICDQMERDRICTPDGVFKWNRGATKRLIEHPCTRIQGDKGPLVPNPEAVASWRSFLVNKLFLDCAGPDPMFQVRYGLQMRIDGATLRVRSSQVITTAPRADFMRRLAAVPWMAGAWEEADLPKPEAG